MNIDSRVMNIIKTEKITNTDIDLLSNLDCDKQSYYRNLIISENHKIKIPSYALWRPIDIMYQDGDASFIREELGWEPTIKIEDTISDLLNYWCKKLE